MVRRRFELAAHIHQLDHTGDRELLQDHGWLLTDPTRVAGSPEAYGTTSSVPAPICSARNRSSESSTPGWMSDRSVCYLASGRPVLAEDTGFSDVMPCGKGLIAFTDMEEAVAGVARD
jgi:hypothetical protein